MDWFVNSVRLLAKGGYVMIPLLLCSVVSLTVLIERYVKVRQAHKDCGDVIDRAQEAVYSGQHQKALVLLESHDAPVTRVLAAGLRNRHLGERGSERAMEERGTRETSHLTRHLGLLDTIITIAPLLGLLGTVTGMISAFHVIAAKDGISTPTAITGGVGEALVATATGLAIAIITLVGHNHIQDKIKHVIADIEAHGTAMVNILAEVGEVRSEVKSISA
jgi:biopolymer transport protein ExbB